MRKNTFIRIWVHLMWGTSNGIKITDKKLQNELFYHLINQASKIKLNIEKLRIQPDHIHCLVSLPADKPLPMVVQLLKGESSHWINENKFLDHVFTWQKGFGAFSVSAHNVEEVKKFFDNQDKVHESLSFEDEFKRWAVSYKVWDD